jgi:hypothetical protein
MDAREELIALRRMAELETKASGQAAPSGGVPVGRTTPGMFDFLSAPFEMGQALAAKPRAEQAAFIAPTVEALGAAGGGLMGAPLGPVGAIGGAGAGYAGAKGLMRLIGGTNVAEPVSRTAQRVASDVAEGATMEVGGQLAGKAIGYGAGKIADLRQLPAQKAATIARNALGPDLPVVLNALKTTPQQGVTVGQATADINSPVWQSLMDRAANRDPRFMEALKASQGEVSVNALAKLAGGATATETRAATEATRRNINKVLEPVKESALKRANLGQTTAQYASDAERLAAEAAQKVQDVRRFEAAKPRAEALARTALIEKNQPVGAAKYTYIGGDLPAFAEKASVDAAQGSLQLGDAARFAKSASDALAQNGMKPLETAPLLQSLQGRVTEEYAGNDVMKAAINNVSRDITEWTNNGGVIDAFALDAIRKNSVNAAVRDLLKGQDPGIQKKAAAEVMGNIRPLLIKAVEDAGGKGYAQYLNNYSNAMQKIAEKKLSGEALKMYKTNPDSFVKLVQGESPDVVEKILGSGKYDIAKEVSDNTLATLQDQAAKVIRDVKVGKQVTAPGSQEALKELLIDNISKFRIPSYLNKVATTTNAALAILENKIGKATMAALTEASKTPGGAVKLLETLPGNERSRVIQLLSNPQQWKPGAGAAAGIAATNALAPQSQNQNALVK